MRRDLDKVLAALTAAGSYNPANDVPARDRYVQDEKLLAGYVMATGEFGPVTLIGGVRVEHYRFGNAGTAQIGSALVPLTVSVTKTDFFPSLNARIGLSDDLILRLSGQRGISRPAYGAIRVGSSINDTASPGTITGGNPGLKPEYTWGVDASLEWYGPSGGIISVAAFHRWVDNVFYSNTQVAASNAFNSGGIDRSGYLLTSTFNGTNGSLYGAEFNLQQQFVFLPSPLDGFGFQGNLTLLRGTFDTELVNGQQRTGIAFPGRSKTIYNASFYFEKYGLSARVSYQWRDDWLDSLGGFGAGESRKAYGNLDVSARYKLNDTLTVFADAANLTNERYIAYEGEPNRVSEVEQIGSRYMFGVRFDF
jgi:TonB-dependent receptor